jgi:hypothetical protein
MNIIDLITGCLFGAIIILFLFVLWMTIASEITTRQRLKVINHMYDYKFYKDKVIRKKYEDISWSDHFATVAAFRNPWELYPRELRNDPEGKWLRILAKYHHSDGE